MRLSLLACLFVSASAFTANHPKAGFGATKLDMASRRDVIGSVLAAGILLPREAGAFSQQLADNAYEPQQQATDGRLDLNSAFVVSLRSVLVYNFLDIVINWALTASFFTFIRASIEYFGVCSPLLLVKLHPTDLMCR